MLGEEGERHHPGRDERRCAGEQSGGDQDRGDQFENSCVEEGHAPTGACCDAKGQPNRWEVARATNARLTDIGWRKVREAAPGHTANVRENVIDALTPEQVRQLAGIAEAILGRLDPGGAMSATYHRYD